MGITESDFEKIKSGFFHYDKLVGKLIIYIYETKDNQYKSLKVTYNKSNFMHLCGVSYMVNDRSNPNEFYNALRDNKVDLNNVHCKSDGTTKQKLQVINDIEYLNTCSVKIINERMSFLKADFDKAIKRKNLLLLGLKYTDEIYVPQSLYNIQKNRIKQKECEVLAVFDTEITEDSIIDNKPSFDLQKALESLR